MSAFVFAVITARGGSKGLPGKNIRPLAGLPLIGWTIQAAQKSHLLSLTWISTDDPAIAAAAKSLGAEAPFLRPAELALDTTASVPVLQHAVRELKSRTGKTPDVVVVLQPTSPLREPSHIDATIRKVTEEGAESAQTVALDLLHPHHRFTMQGDRLLPMFPEIMSESTRRQDYPPVYRPNGAVYAARLPLLMEQGLLRGKDHRGVVMDAESSVDIDSLLDFRIAELILSSRQGQGAR
jgi:N-acylneuraminate cytidylyltransferase